MLEQILDYIHNYFVRKVYRGKYSIVDGSLILDGVQNDQYYKIIGSVFNDGVHQYGSDEKLKDEEFVGEIWAMAVPPALLSLCGEVEAWIAKYGDVMNSPYSSESFGGYSYSKSQGSNYNNNNAASSSWQAIFGNRLNHWRKIS